MPLIVIVQLHHGRTGEVSELSRMQIENVGGTKELGNYKVILNPEEPRSSEHRVVGAIHKHARLKENVWSLVGKAIESVRYWP